MPIEPRPAKLPAVPSKEGTSTAVSRSQKAQLSSPSRVENSVSSVAMDRGLLSITGGPLPSPLDSSAALPNGPSDADIMLRVKAGDDTAFEYLVEKYRRPMVSFMYRMLHSSTAA